MKTFFILEHDFYLQENRETTFKRLKSSINVLDKGYDCVKLRSMSKFFYRFLSNKIFG